MRLRELVDGMDSVSDQGAREVFEILAPLLSEVPDDSGLAEAAAKVVAKMPPSSRLAAALDWWLVVTAHASSPLGLAFHLPDDLPSPLRSAMQGLADLTHEGLRTPPAQWVRARRRLERLLPELEERLSLDSYGRSKLPGEREAWAWLREQLYPVVAALQEGKPTGRFQLDERDYEKELSRAGITDGSRRWVEMVKRAGECIAAVNDLVDVHTVAEPWRALPVPPMVSIPPDLAAEVAGLGDWLFVAITNPADYDSVEEASHQEVADSLAALGADADPADLMWLAELAGPWMRRTGHQVPRLAPTLERRDGIQDELHKLRKAGVDADDVELAVLDHDLDTAEALIQEHQQRQQQQRRAANIGTQLVRYRAMVEGGGAPPWLAEDLDSADRLVAEGAHSAAEQAVHALGQRLREASRAETVVELSRLLTGLESLGAPQSLLTEVRGQQAAMQQESDRPVDPSVVQRTRERFDTLMAERRRETEQRLQAARELLDMEADELDPHALPELEVRLATVQAVMGDGELLQALALAEGLLHDIESQRLRRWRAAEGEQVLVDHIVSFCTQRVHFDPVDVHRLYVAAKTKPFVILAGLTGSGKSSIARLFAGALGADSGNGRFRRVAVRPDWIDQSDVLGSVNPISNRFEPGWLAVVARQCEQDLDQLHVVLLDEMNLAPVEQYLAEYLSALEEARSGAEQTVLPLYSSGASPDNAGEWPAALPFPGNLILIGTVNVDETTRVLSERVLDRANVLQLSAAVSDAHHRGRERSVRPWLVPYPEWAAVCATQPYDGHHEFLLEVAETLEAVGVGVGQRAHVELERFVANASGILSLEQSLDVGVLQRIIPKVRGFKRDLLPGLVELHDLLDSTGCRRSALVTARWLADTVSDDEYLDGTDARIGLLR